MSLLDQCHTIPHCYSNFGHYLRPGNPSWYDVHRNHFSLYIGGHLCPHLTVRAWDHASSLRSNHLNDDGRTWWTIIGLLENRFEQTETSAVEDDSAIETAKKKTRFPWQRDPTRQSARNAVYAICAFGNPCKKIIEWLDFDYTSILYRCDGFGLGWGYSRHWRPNRYGPRLVPLRSGYRSGSGALVDFLFIHTSAIEKAALFQSARSSIHTVHIHRHQPLFNVFIIIRYLDPFRSLDGPW